MNVWAFDNRVNPLGAKLNAIFSSDIGHWDVTNIREVVAEAYELGEHDIMTPEDFKAFTYTNAVDLYAGMNPNFFAGTVLESEVVSTA